MIKLVSKILVDWSAAEVGAFVVGLAVSWIVGSVRKWNKERRMKRLGYAIRCAARLGVEHSVRALRRDLAKERARFY